MKRKLVFVKCPKCGREYLPSEIFIPKSFFGAPDFIKRDINGAIENFTGTSMDTDELYCCDNCNTSFKVTTKISFDTEINVETDFNSDYESTLKSRFTIKEF